ncbi:MAG TPA: (d)CMP kinase [Oculatellaceae cyanobacterium]
MIETSQQQEKQAAPVGNQPDRAKPISRPKTALKIAIDGPAGAGKSTVAKRIADKLGYLYIDTGAMYRALTWLVIKNGIDINDEAGIIELVRTAKIVLKPGDKTSRQLARVFINGQEITKQIRTPEITKLTSSLSTIAAVRAYLVEQQRTMASDGGVVLDGRDIGTVVLPDANIKIFLTASPEVRAKRRYAELRAQGEEVNFDALLKEIIDRDNRDTHRTIAPLCMAEDAVLILSDNMQIDEVVSYIIGLCT